MPGCDIISLAEWWWSRSAWLWFRGRRKWGHTGLTWWTAEAPCSHRAGTGPAREITVEKKSTPRLMFIMLASYMRSHRLDMVDSWSSAFSQSSDWTRRGNNCRGKKGNHMAEMHTVNVVNFAGVKILRKWWQDISRGGNFHDTTPIYFIKAYGFYFSGNFCEEDKSAKNMKITPTRKFSHLQYMIWNCFSFHCTFMKWVVCFIFPSLCQGDIKCILSFINALWNENWFLIPFITWKTCNEIGK